MYIEHSHTTLSSSLAFVCWKSVAWSSLFKNKIVLFKPFEKIFLRCAIFKKEGNIFLCFQMISSISFTWMKWNFFLNICHYFTISALKLIKLYKRLRTVLKQKVNLVGKKKTLQIGTIKNLWAAFAFGGELAHIQAVPECLVIWSVFNMGKNRNDSKANVFKIKTWHIWKLSVEYFGNIGDTLDFLTSKWIAIF